MFKKKQHIHAGQNQLSSNGRAFVLPLALLLIVSLPLALLSPQPVRGAMKTEVSPPALKTHAQASSLIDVASGRIIYAAEGDRELRIASLTKIMTAIVAIEHGRLQDQVKVSPTAYAKEGSSLFLRMGEQMTLENMLYGLMLRSGNDAASAIAEHVGGTEEGFVHLMNEKAVQLGLSHTHFANPHGLDTEGHYSSANDMARLTAYALHNPTFAHIVKTELKKAPNPNDPWDYSWRNKNKMLRLYEGADGVKTGYTKKAFRCLVSSATRDGRQLAAVTLNDGDDWNDHAHMLDYGFQYYPLIPITDKQQPIKGYPLLTGSSFAYPLNDGEKSQLHKRLVLYKKSRSAGRSDVSFGLRGRVEFLLEGKLIGSVPVYAKGSKLPTPRTIQPGQEVPTDQAPVSSTQQRSWTSGWSVIIRNLFGV
ncbi:D-alanyl-D-alanine carboxypeptidase [Paenibacillus kribbensis]|uniref:D-alanyl-D-alanine carboxypeptidase n=1 Tax=Paenibacillus kribbensis TaxID=172713 RepID=A0A222WM45_9BACL|nr:D-alanyl-D-alanine carboxypeptidase family protein [Paenibacillus kribbensis]ASR47048.1 D-alanyl-D-alanine carboxypeptidase [Paenibacillus kribbensis]